MTEVRLTVPGYPPAKNEAQSMLGAGHPHAPRVVALLTTAQAALPSNFSCLHGPIGLDVVVHTAAGQDPWDATNYLGGIGDVLEDKTNRGRASLAHLGDLVDVAVYRNDRQIREVDYRTEPASRPSYSVRIYELTREKLATAEPAQG